MHILYKTLYISKCNYFLDAVPTFMKVQDSQYILNVQNFYPCYTFALYGILKVHSRLQLCTCNTAVYGNLLD